MVVIHRCPKCNRYWKCWEEFCESGLFIHCPECTEDEEILVEYFSTKLEAILEAL